MLFISCSSEQPREQRIVPDGVLSQDSMAYYLSQVHIIDAAMRHRDVRKNNLQSYAKKGFIEYFDTASIGHERFVSSLEFWGDDFEDMKEVYDLAMERLSTKMAKLKSEEKKSNSGKTP